MVHGCLQPLLFLFFFSTIPGSIRHTATDLFSQDFSPFSSATGPIDVADKNGEKPFDFNGCGAVAAEKPGEAGKEAGEADLAALGSVLREWKAAIGIGQQCTLDQVIELASSHCADLKAALLAVAPMDDVTAISNVRLARWLRDYNEVAVGGLCLSGGGVDGNGSPLWTLLNTELGLSRRTLEQLANSYKERGDAQRNGGSEVDQEELDAGLRQVLAEMVLPEHVETEFVRVMAIVFAS